MWIFNRYVLMVLGAALFTEGLLSPGLQLVESFIGGMIFGTALGMVFTKSGLKFAQDD